MRVLLVTANPGRVNLPPSGEDEPSMAVMPGSALTGHRFDVIIVKRGDIPRRLREWVVREVRTRLVAGGAWIEL